MKNLVLLIAACLLCSSAVAQQGNTKQECTRRCLSMDPDTPKKAQHEQRLKQIRDKKAAETDAAKRKALEQAESEELSRHQDELENMCHTICAPLRDE